MALTLLQLTNRVLRRMREDQVTDLTTDPYSKVVAEFVADAHRDVVQAHDWALMDKDILVVTAPGVSSYSLAVGSTDLYSGYVGLTEQAQLRYLDDAPIGYVYASVAAFGNGDALNELQQAVHTEIVDSLRTRVSTTGRPSLFSIQPTSAGLTLVLDAPADGVYYLYLRFHDPEAAIDVDVDAARLIYAPEAPVISGALLYALNERGEEIGEPGNMAERRFLTALGMAIEADTSRATRTNTHEMYRD